MNIKALIDSVSLSDFLGDFKSAAEQENIPFDDALKAILSCTFNNPSLAASIKGSSKNQVILKWLKKYNNGYDKRISERISNLPGTISDPAIGFIIQARLSHLSTADLTKIKFAHRLAMSAENILGLFLEEYLSIKMKQFGWFFCWGDVVRAVDFCNSDGRLLQIKNRSNSENSSSSRVRIDTGIQKWHRVNAQTGEYLWNELNETHNTDIFSEDSFLEFIKEILIKNPNALAVEQSNPWRN